MVIACTRVPKTVGVLWLNGKHYRLKRVESFHRPTKASDISIATVNHLPDSDDLCNTVAVAVGDLIIEIVVNGETLWHGPAEITAFNRPRFPDVMHMVVKPKAANMIDGIANSSRLPSIAP